ncbi:MAG: LysR family transcriptional regulator [Pseudomonadota bacterium]
MQKSDQISLNAIRIFAVVAKLQSLKRAADQFGVTPGAVSKQMLKLETAMGVKLLERKNNSVLLTEAGEAFYRSIAADLQSLNGAIKTAMIEQQQITVLVSTTLAVRWLIPLLENFRKKHPDISVRLETGNDLTVRDVQGIHVVLGYSAIGASPKPTGILFKDLCRPYVAPKLLTQLSDRNDLSAIPALQSTVTNWDWRTWLNAAGLDHTLKFGEYFDFDDAAIRAAISGLGMTLSSEFIVRDDIDSGRLCALPDSHEVLLGYYTIDVPKPATRPTDAFVKWLLSMR